MKKITFLLLLLTAVLSINGFTQKTKKMKQTIVLVHGAWMDQSAWYKVKPILQMKGYDVITVNLPGHGTDTTSYQNITLDGYVNAVKAAIGTKTNVILVGHSMAGVVISQVAEQIPSQISKLVYVAAYLPQNGESLYQISQQDKDSHVGKYWRQDDPQHYSPASIAPEGIKEVFAADAPDTDVQNLIAHHKADALAPMATPVTLTSGNFGSVKKVYIHTTKDNAVSYSLQRMMLDKTHVDKVYELNTSHSPFFSQPQALADLITK